MPPFEAKTSALWVCLQCTFCYHPRPGSEQHTRQDCPALADPIHPSPSWCVRAPQIEQSSPYSFLHAGRRMACPKTFLTPVVRFPCTLLSMLAPSCAKQRSLPPFSNIASRLFVSLNLISFFLPHVYALYSVTPKHKGKKKKSNTGKRTNDTSLKKILPVSQNLSGALLTSHYRLFSCVVDACHSFYLCSCEF
jgi:hypothetical protein